MKINYIEPAGDNYDLDKKKLNWIELFMISIAAKINYVDRGVLYLDII